MRVVLMLCILLSTISLSTIAQAPQSTEEGKPREYFYVITHTSVPTLSESQLKTLFSLQKQLLPNNKRAVLAVMVPTHDTANAMSQHFFNYFAYQLQRLWDREVFAGRAVAPQQFDSQVTLLKYVAKTPNSIGYIDAKTFDTEDPDLAKIKGNIHVISSFQ